MKAVWIIVLVVLPYLGILIYLIARGQGMPGRAAKQNALIQEQMDNRIRATAGTTTTPADQIAQAKTLLDSGAIDQAEFDRLKAVALAPELIQRTFPEEDRHAAKRLNRTRSVVATGVTT